MLRRRWAILGLSATAALFVGCASTDAPSPPLSYQGGSAASAPDLNDRQAPSDIQLTSYQDQEPISPGATIPAVEVSSLVALEQTALRQNPRLLRLFDDFQAASAKSQYVDKLPDPRIGANVFGDPIETAAGSQRANLSISQTIPWLSRLSAEEQRAIFEGYAIHSELEAERLRVIAEVRAGWYRLYVIDREIEITKANQRLLDSLIQLANARVATGAASQGDVLLGTVELSELQARLLLYQRQRQGVQADLNRLLSRPADQPIENFAVLNAEMPAIPLEQITQLAVANQPELEAARLRTQATRWGIEVARLKRRPEFMISANYFPTDNNRPPSTFVNVGQDPWAIGAQMSIPIWKQRYDAMEDEARWKHHAAHASVEELADRYESLIVDLYAEAKRAYETAVLYEMTILPQARQTLSADQESYANGGVEFDRVVRDNRNLLTLELGYHQAVGDLATAIARLQQVAGTDFGSR